MIDFAVRPPAPNAGSIVEDGVKVLGITPRNATLVSSYSLVILGT